jgi:hypothetical protein
LLVGGAFQVVDDGFVCVCAGTSWQATDHLFLGRNR